jgi:hypothetical protein
MLRDIRFGARLTQNDSALSEQATLIQDQLPARNIDSKIRLFGTRRDLSLHCARSCG